MRVFYVAGAQTAQDFQAIATQVRTSAKIRRAFTYNAPRALALRGTLDQITQAESLLKEAGQ